MYNLSPIICIIKKNIILFFSLFYWGRMFWFYLNSDKYTLNKIKNNAIKLDALFIFDNILLAEILSITEILYRWQRQSCFAQMVKPPINFISHVRTYIKIYNYMCNILSYDNTYIIFMYLRKNIILLGQKHVKDCI